MPKPRGRNARNTANVVGRGSSGYKTGERYVLPKMTPLICPACPKCIDYHKPTNTFACRHCGGKFTTAQVKASNNARAAAVDHKRNDRLRRQMEEKLARWADQDRVRRTLLEDGDTSVVYYIRFRDTVKIGTSIDVASRLKLHPWEELVAIEPGGRKVEQRRHKALQAHRVDGEWFELTDEVREYIADINRVNAAWYAEVFACAGPLPAAKAGAKFPRLTDYPSIV